MGDEKDDVFEYGEKTTFRLRDQEFLSDDYGTVMNVPTPEVPAPPPPDETKSELARIEEKLDAVLHGLETLQRRVDSIDAMIARVLTR